MASLDIPVTTLVYHNILFFPESPYKTARRQMFLLQAISLWEDDVSLLIKRIIRGDSDMLNDNYVTFKILGINNGSGSSFTFGQDVVCRIENDDYIEKIIITADISNARFSLHDSLKIEKESVHQIVNYLQAFLARMMIGLVKNSSRYSSVGLKPVICLSAVSFSDSADINLHLKEYVSMREALSVQMKLDDGDNIVQRWIDSTEFSDYTRKKDRYDILLLLLQGDNLTQKYMAMYAYLLSLVKEIYSNLHEAQKQVVQYISDNCSRVGIELFLAPSNRPGAKPHDEEDQFTKLRNKVAHPVALHDLVRVNEADVNGLASIICCAIEDVNVDEN